MGGGGVGGAQFLGLAKSIYYFDFTAMLSVCIAQQSILSSRGLHSQLCMSEFIPTFNV